MRDNKPLDLICIGLLIINICMIVNLLFTPKIQRNITDLNKQVKMLSETNSCLRKDVDLLTEKLEDNSNKIADMKIEIDGKADLTTEEITTEEVTTEKVKVTTESTTTETTTEDAKETKKDNKNKEDLPTEEVKEEKKNTDGVLTKAKGVNDYNGHKETYYNLNMDGVVSIMRNLGYSEEEYPYWVRDDGVKMLGKYVMVGADFNLHPRGSIVETSLGTAIVVDTGYFYYPDSFDIAVTW